MQTGTGMQAAATAMETAFAADNIWGGITPFIPVIGIVTIVCLGIGIFYKVQKRVRKGR